MRLNRGEWAELVVALKLITTKKLTLCNSSLEKIQNTYYEDIGSVTFMGANKLTFVITDKNIDVKVNEALVATVTMDEIKGILKALMQGIKEHRSGNGAFDIPVVSNWLLNTCGCDSFKSPANKKADLSISVFDTQENKNIDLTYSIKSSLGSPSTILNASKHTNFKYRVDNITAEQVKEINSINTRHKLIDRFQYLSNKDIGITFESVVSNTMLYNLQLTHPELSSVLSKVLISSYSKRNNKDLYSLFMKALNNDKVKVNQLLVGLLENISFGFIPSETWDFKYQVEGGLILVSSNYDVIVLDNKYNRKELLQYILSNSKLDTPSSTRFNMLEIQQDVDGYYFTLNLQIRYKN